MDRTCARQALDRPADARSFDNEPANDAERNRWLASLSSALGEAREMLVEFDDGERSSSLIERIDALQEEIELLREGTIDFPLSNDPIWMEFGPWRTGDGD